MDKNKRESIEKAVIARGGVFDVVSDNSHSGSDCLYVWSDGEYVNLVYGMEQCTCKLVCTRAEFEQVKAELQNKPSWADAPEWAVALIQDCDGHWLWLNVKPRVLSTGFCPNGKYRLGGRGKAIGDWRDTLEERPETPPYATREAMAAHSINPSDFEIEVDSDWHTRGELPPVGEVVEIIDHEDLMYGHGESGEVIAHVEDSAVVRMSYGLGCFRAKVLRPLRTERDELIEQIKNDSRKYIGDIPSTITNDCAGILIDRGWRPTK